MESETSLPSFTPRQQTIIVSVGFMTVMLAGVATCAALILAVIWGIVQFSLLVLQATVFTLSTIGTTFTSASADIRLLVLVLVAIGLYRVYRKTTERAKR